MSKPTFHFVTLFPDAIRSWLTTSILGRAKKAGLFDFELIQLRDYAHDKHRSVDDVAYGGGGGMVLRVEPLVEAVEKLIARLSRDACRVIYFSPAGQPLTHELIEKLDQKESPRHFIFVCGHYEGVDQRFIDHWVDLELSLGDFVLTGGELPAVALTDALVRRLEGSLGNRDAHTRESFSIRDPESQKRLLEYPHFTRPAEFRGLKVPGALLSGDHRQIDEWRMSQAKAKTKRLRPDLLS